MEKAIKKEMDKEESGVATALQQDPDILCEKLFNLWIRRLDLDKPKNLYMRKPFTDPHTFLQNTFGNYQEQLFSLLEGNFLQYLNKDGISCNYLDINNNKFISLLIVTINVFRY